MTKKYRFRLDAVLRVRRIQEELARQDLALANREQAQARQHLERRAALHAGRPSGPSEETSDAFLARRSASAVSAAAVSAARANWQMAVDAAAIRREGWAGAKSRLRSLERLDERHRELHDLDAARDEQRELDDLSSGRAAVQDEEGAG
jgi:flagellar export protein FliJ